MGSDRITGVVKWFNSSKGYGFIEAEGVDYFVHFKEISMQGYKELKERQRVSFVGRKGLKGFQAEQVMAV